MEEVRPDDYGNSREYRRFLTSEEERKEMPLYQKMGIGVVATAGALALGYRTGAMRRLARFLDDEVTVRTQALRETLDEQGSFTKNLNMERLREARSTYRERQAELRQLRQDMGDMRRLEDYDMVRYLRQRENLIEKEVPAHIREGLRFQSVLKEIRERVDKETADLIESGLAKGYNGILQMGNRSDIRYLLNQAGVHDKEIIDMVDEVRRKNKGHGFDQKNLDAWTQSMQQKLREATARDIQNLTKQDGIVRRAIMGSGQRQATVQDILELHKQGKFELDPDVLAQIEDVRKYNKSFSEAVFDSNLYVNIRDGKVTDFVDYKIFDDIKRRQMEWWSHTLPGGLFHLRDIINIRAAKESSSFRIFERGTIQPMLAGHLGLKPDQPLTEDFVYAAGRFYRLFDNEAVIGRKPLQPVNQREMYLTSARYGTISSIARQMSGTMTDGRRSLFGIDVTDNKLAQLLDIGGQERHPVGAEWFTVFSKFWNKDWDRRKVNRALREGIQSPSEFHDMIRFMDQNTTGFSSRTMRELTKHLPDHIREEFEKLNFSRDEDILQAFQFLGKNEKTSYTFNQLYRRFQRNPEDVLGRTTPRDATNWILGGRLKIRTGIDDIRREVSREMIRQIAEVKPAGMVPATDEMLNIRNVLRKSFEDGRIRKRDLQEAEWLINQSMFEYVGQAVGRSYENILTDVNALILGQSETSQAFRESLREMSRKANPLLNKDRHATHINQIGDEFIAVNKANVWENLKSLEGISDLMKQASLRTGRRNTEDVTTLSIYGSFYPAYRLQDALGSLGLGFSDASMGTPLQIWSSLFLKRGLPIVGVVGGYQYLDYLTDKFTGAGITERWENYKAYQRLQDASAREQFDAIDELQRERMLKPGIEHLDAMPSVHIPGIGEVGPGHLLNAVLGLFTGGSAPLGEQDTMTVEETIEDLLYGTEEIRKGRWWAFGSRTPYRGDRIIEFAPNSYRLAHSDWEHSSVTASAEERYAHSLFPTLENPLGALSFLIGTRDPYWFEKKHYYDRPYLLTGDLFNPNTVFFGDIGNMTIGQILKPTREMHPEYWGDPVLIQEEVERERELGPVRVRISPSGRIQYYTEATPADFGAGPDENVYYADMLDSDVESEPFYIVRHRYDAETGEPTGDYIAGDPATRQVIFVPRRVSGQYESIGQAFYDANIAESRTVNVAQPDAYAPQYEYHKQVDRQKLREVIDPRSSEWRGQELARNWLEPHGVYNWILIDELIGWDPYIGQTVIAKADQAYNASNRFWRQELGSLGGSLSEIGRRFIRRDSGQLEFYNPVRNTMPDWLPGSDYFIDFKTGDPYAKIPFGERRLPGEAYERLHELHPDETGRYGAFDKFKILADVAPWSDEYKFWRDYVTEYIEDPELRKQIAEIKRQVSKRKQKYEFYDYMFKDAELEKQQVTVTKFLDDYTFLTEEYPDQPIRLAGVDVRPNAEGVLQQYFDVGDTITIGIDADETQRIANDTYGTMRAVVFRGIESLNRQIIERGEMKEAENDFSAPGVWARFTPEEIARGARWETIAHAETAFNTKFLHVRTAVEEYERDQIYLTDWATWEWFGLKDYGIPAIQRLAGLESMTAAIIKGALFGGVIGRFFLGGGRRTIGGLTLGALTGVVANTYGKIYEFHTSERWIPKRRRIEHDINEYFDILQYLKFSGLYEKARQELAHMGYDIDAFVQHIEEKERQTKEERAELEARKRELYLQQPKGWEEERRKINLELQKIDERWDDLIIPAPVAQALYYKEMRDTTLYAIDPYEDRMKIMQALPYKDRWFFNEFAEAGKEEREKILSLVPENQRRIYQAIWGMEPEPQKPLEYYAQKYHIPDASWEGWSPAYSLEDIKVKVVQDAGLDLTDFNYWQDDIERAEYAPDLPLPYDEPGFQGFKSVERNIREVMQGYGLKNVQVLVRPSYGNETHARITFEEDRTKEIENELKYNMEAYV